MNVCMAMNRGPKEETRVEETLCPSCLAVHYDLTTQITPARWLGNPVLNLVDDNNGLGEPLPRKNSQYMLRPAMKKSWSRDQPQSQSARLHFRKRRVQVDFKTTVQCNIIPSQAGTKSIWREEDQTMVGDTTLVGSFALLRLHTGESTIRRHHMDSRRGRKSKKLMMKPLRAATSQRVIDPIFEAYNVLEKRLHSLESLIKPVKDTHAGLKKRHAQQLVAAKTRSEREALLMPPALGEIDLGLSSQVREQREKFQGLFEHLLDYHNKFIAVMRMRGRRETVLTREIREPQRQAVQISSRAPISSASSSTSASTAQSLPEYSQPSSSSSLASASAEFSCADSRPFLSSAASFSRPRPLRRETRRLPAKMPTGPEMTGQAPADWDHEHQPVTPRAAEHTRMCGRFPAMPQNSSFEPNDSTEPRSRGPVSRECKISDSLPTEINSNVFPDDRVLLRDQLSTPVRDQLRAAVQNQIGAGSENRPALVGQLRSKVAGQLVLDDEMGSRPDEENLATYYVSFPPPASRQQRFALKERIGIRLGRPIKIMQTESGARIVPVPMPQQPTKKVVRVAGWVGRKLKL